jgi:hypothetical protein
MKIRAKLKIKGNAITTLGLSPAERGGNFDGRLPSLVRITK